MKSFYLITYTSSRKMALNFILMKQVCQRKIYFCCHLIFIVLNILVAILECDNVTVSLFEMGWHCNFAFFMNCQCCLCKKMCVCPCVRAYICMRMWKNCASHVGAWRGIFMFLCICVWVCVCVREILHVLRCTYNSTCSGVNVWVWLVFAE